MTRKPTSKRPPSEAVAGAEDELFLQAMRELQVRGKSRPNKSPADDPAEVQCAPSSVPHSEDAEFLQAMDDLMAGRFAYDFVTEPQSPASAQAQAAAPLDVVVSTDPDDAPSAESSATSLRSIARRLRKGELEPEATLDLHGMKKAEAIQSTERFLRKAVHDEQRVVLVITGRGLHSDGLGVLRELVPLELRRRWPALVHAVVAAPRRLGGEGAFVVLLRRNA